VTAVKANWAASGVPDDCVLGIVSARLIMADVFRTVSPERKRH
jgi:hypothetical protein